MFNCRDCISECLFGTWSEYFDSAFLSKYAGAVVEVRGTAPWLNAKERSVLRLPYAKTCEIRVVDANADIFAVEQFNLPIEKTVKTLLVKAVEDSASPLVALLVRGDHELNEVKAEKLPQVASPLTFATEEEIRALVNAGPGSLGPVNMPVPVIIDRTVAVMSDFAAGANIDGKHYFGINWDRDVATP